MRVVSERNVSVYVYVEVGGRHHLPHCHVRRAEDVWVISIPLLNVLYGPKLPGSVRELVVSHLDEIVQAWEQLNQ